MRAKLNKLDVECLLACHIFKSDYDKREFIEYLVHYQLISEKTRNELLKEEN